jgi:GTP diphosphokinase / guanosine-3',5'-bis(diphosphate) 3'-diphosphatase
MIRIADKICNIRDVVRNPPADWDAERKAEYLTWAAQVVAGCRGVRPTLDTIFEQTLTWAHEQLGLGAGCGA